MVVGTPDICFFPQYVCYGCYLSQLSRVFYTEQCLRSVHETILANKTSCCYDEEFIHLVSCKISIWGALTMHFSDVAIFILSVWKQPLNRRQWDWPVRAIHPTMEWSNWIAATTVCIVVIAMASVPVSTSRALSTSRGGCFWDKFPHTKPHSTMMEVEIAMR